MSDWLDNVDWQKRAWELQTEVTRLSNLLTLETERAVKAGGQHFGALREVEDWKYRYFKQQERIKELEEGITINESKKEGKYGDIGFCMNADKELYALLESKR